MYSTQFFLFTPKCLRESSTVSIIWWTW